MIGLSKKDGGISPIALGDVYRRLTGKCLSSLILSDANSFFLPFQCVHALGGGKAVVHSWRHSMHELQQNADLMGQTIDFIKAFNTVKRDILLKECYNDVPQI